MDTPPYEGLIEIPESIDSNDFPYLKVDGEIVSIDTEAKMTALRNEMKGTFITIADEMTDLAIVSILKEKATRNQIKRYQDKYERALRVAEAVSAGEIPTETNPDILNEYQAIIEKYEAMQETIQSIVDVYEYARRRGEDIVDTDMDRATTLLDTLNKKSLMLTYADVDAILS